MKKDPLSFLDTPCLFGYSPIDLRSYFADPAFLDNLDSAVPINYLQPITAPAKTPDRQQVLDRLLDKICEQDLLGKSYVEQYLRHKYRRNCKANTLRQAAISLEQFLSLFANRGNTVLEQLSREEIEAFVEELQDRGLKPTTVNTRLRNVYAFVRYLILEYTGFDWGLMERKVKGEGFQPSPMGTLKNIPINYHVEKILNTVPRALKHDFVFTYRGKSFAEGGIKRSFTTACKNAGVPYGRKIPNGITFHDIRRTVKTHMLNAGVSKVFRDVILGHSLRGMDIHYIVTSDESLRAAMNRYTRWLDEKIANAQNLLTKPLTKSNNSLQKNSESY